ncbi:MAG: hsp70 family protein [Deltaproteobacteria bacterium]|nr:hsp70 family protein [Deltaproteobacteria bacterium]
MAAKYVVGIDLGTTNTVVACASVDAARAEEPGRAVAVFPVPQFLSPGEVSALPALPSALYLPHPDELPRDQLRLPWDAAAPTAAPVLVGEVAKRLGAKTPGRLVTSAKSWLCHGGVDREAPILPWGAPDEVRRLSPVAASTGVLCHVVNAWNHAHPDAPLPEQEVVLTVPASFDEVARELTVKAAAEAGLPRLFLVEEPQAAFYDFVGAAGSALARALDGTRLVLVVDVGGGTTDLTLVEVGHAPNGEVTLKRIAVGDHILLGGDNMDLALARLCEQRALGGTGKLEVAQYAQLVHVCRLGKQALLSDKGGPPRYGISVAGRGSKLVGGAIKVELAREEALAVLLDGFFPVGPAEQARPRGRAGGLMELGLPYAHETAVPRHVSAFLWRHAAAARAVLGQPADSTLLPRPDAVLLNGGVFRAGAIRTRLQEVFNAWWPGAPPVPSLPYTSLDAAVARGAVYHGLTRRGLGYRIGGGTARAYYVGLDGDRALCVIPRGHEGMEELTLPRTFALTVGRPARFPLFASSTGHHALGEVVTLQPAEAYEPLPPIQTVLEGKGGEVPVQLHALATDIGTLELSLVSADARWRLQFQLRGGGGGAPVEERRVEGSIPPQQRGLVDARDQLERIYGRRPQPVEPRDVKNLGRALGKALGERDSWNTATLRELFTVLWSGADRRRRTPDHERVWFQWAGYCLRPGFGAPLDPFRVNDLWSIYEPGVQHTSQVPNWVEWWVMWRRVAGGLNRAQHERILETLTPYLRPHTGRGPPPRPKGPRAEGREEMVRLAASLERLPAERKAEVGRWLLHELEAADGARRSWWTLGRVGARVPFHGSAADVVRTATVEEWLDKLLARDWAKTEGAAFAATLLARRTQDRARDVSDAIRARVLDRLRPVPGSEGWVALVETGSHGLEVADQARMLGESLPPGLRLVEDEEPAPAG